MEFVVLIISVLAVSKTINSDSQKDLSIIIGLSFGVVFFFVWPFLDYYLRLVSYEDVSRQIILSAMIVFLVFFSRALLLVERIEIIKILAVVVFMISWGITSEYEIDVKDYLAEKAGFFDHELATSSENNDLVKKTIFSPQKAYTVMVPDYWELSKNKSIHLPSYVPSTNNDAITEFRLRCYDRQHMNITDIIERLTKRFDESKTNDFYCYKWREIGYACRVRLNNALGNAERIRWFAVNKDTRRMLGLDFIVNESGHEVMLLVNEIIKSVAFTNEKVPAYDCVYPIEWF